MVRDDKFVNVRQLKMSLQRVKSELTSQAPVYRTATLAASGWGTSVPYTQTVDVSGISESDRPTIDVMLSGTVAADKIRLQEWIKVSRIITADGNITAYCLEEKPTADLPIKIEIIQDVGNGSGGGVGYTLPQASDIVLGGVKANTAQQTDTQEVRIDTDGFLKIEPYIHPSYTAQSNGLYKLTINSHGHVTEAEAVQKTDITSLGIPGQDTTYNNATASAAGLMSADDKEKLNSIAANANNYTLPVAGTVLGGVKGSIPTSEQTETAGIDEEGNIKVTPRVDISGLQDKITVNGLLKGDGNGGVTAASENIDYAEPSKAKTVSLTASGWTGTSAPYSQEVDVVGVTASNNIIASPAPNSFNDWVDAKVYCSTQAAGKLTFKCMTKPSVELTANILIVG